MGLESLAKYQPLNIADFMQEAMFNPLYGYYQTKNPFGKKGDFITAPKISQIFGELIAAYFLNFILNEKEEVSLVEMGAGCGTLFKDILITFDKITKKLNKTIKVNYNIIEISEN